jgi:CBS domain-containing protein
MTRELITVSPDTDVVSATKLLLEHHINGLPVTDGTGKLVGILCQSDLIAQQKKLPIPSFFTFMDGLVRITSMKEIEKQVQKIAATVVVDAMTPDPITVQPDTDIEEVATLMVEEKIHSLPVLENGKLVGIVGKDDVLRTLITV